MNQETATPLDNPIWAALTTKNRHLGEGGTLARRYAPEVAPFAAVADRSPAAWKALAALVPRDGRVALATIDAPAAPPGLTIETRAPLLQMVLDAPIDSLPSRDHISLDAARLAEMLDLAGRTRPGPFGRRTIEFGRYIGIQEKDMLVAMAGERMRLEGFVEISAVCVHPDHRGKGHAANLVAQLARDLQAQGKTPFLHVLAGNLGAISLYRRLGFTERRELHFTTLRADGAD